MRVRVDWLIVGIATVEAVAQLVEIAPHHHRATFQRPSP
jgi:hypothetical protein